MPGVARQRQNAKWLAGVLGRGDLGSGFHAQKEKGTFPDEYLHQQLGLIQLVVPRHSPLWAKG